MGGFRVGSSDVVYPGPESRLPMIVMRTDPASPFAPEPKPEPHAIVFDIEPLIRLMALQQAGKRAAAHRAQPPRG